MPINEVTVAERRTLRVPFPASTAIAAGDLLWWDNSAKFAKRASARSDAGSVAANQADFAPLFIGVAGDQRLAAETSVTVVATAPTGPSDRLVVPEGIFDVTVASATFEYGDLVGVSRDATPLNTNQTLAKVANRNLAIGFVVRREPTATTLARVFLSSYVFGWLAAQSQGLMGASVLSGTGSPATVVTAAKGTLFLRLDGSSTSTRAYINTDGATAWAAITTAS
jgi:hypothetical protein